ncbi:YidC/Oxa1 family membrane protein insertase [Patescibacteria group bacterium]
MSDLWNILLYHPFVNGLIFLYQLLFNNLGLAIIGLTLVIRGLLIPLTLPSLKASQKMKELAPELGKLKKRHKNDKQAYARAQMELYKKHGANPAAGCLPQIVQLVILIALYQAFRQVLTIDGDSITRLNEILYSSLKLPQETVINTSFTYLDLAKPDIFKLPEGFLGGVIPGIPGLFLLGAALTQFISSKLMVPQAKKAEEVAKKTPGEMDNMASMMQKQMLYIFPLMTLLIGFSFPSGLVLYWFVFSILTALQQYYVKLQSDKNNAKKVILK